MNAGKAISSHEDAEAAADETLRSGGNAIDAILGGFFAAAALDAGTLFAPLAVLVGGVGQGARSIDGRALQPGKGLRRPRGFAADEPIPEAAYAANPRSLAALAVAHTYGANRALSTLLRPAVANARKLGCSARAGILSAFGSRGPRALQQSDVVRALSIAAGPTAGGMLVEADLEEVSNVDAPAGKHALTEGTVAAMPSWQNPAIEGRAGAASSAAHMRCSEVLVAADAKGTVAALAWAPDPEGLLVPELELRLPRDAEPVRRGVPRVASRTPRPAALPIAVLSRPSEGWYAALGHRAHTDLRVASLRLGSSGLAGLLDDLVSHERGSVAVAVSNSRGKVQSQRSARRA